MQGSAKSREVLVTALYEQYAALILYTVRQQLPFGEEAEDILLEVFLAALESDTFLRLQEDGQVGWLRRVAQNKCADYYRQVYRRPVVSLERHVSYETLPDLEERNPEEAALYEEEVRLLYQQLADLPRQQQEVVRLRFGENMRCVDIAQRLQVNEGTVRVWLSRSLRRLRDMYTEQRKEMQ